MKDTDHSGVDADAKNVIAIESAPIIVMEEADVAVGISIVFVAVADADVEMAISMISSVENSRVDSLKDGSELYAMLSDLCGGSHR